MKGGVVTCEVDEQEIQELMDGSRTSIDFWFEDQNISVEVVMMNNEVEEDEA